MILISSSRGISKISDDDTPNTLIHKIIRACYVFGTEVELEIDRSRVRGQIRLDLD